MGVVNATGREEPQKSSSSVPREPQRADMQVHKQVHHGDKTDTEGSGPRSRSRFFKMKRLAEVCSLRSEVGRRSGYLGDLIITYSP